MSEELKRRREEKEGRGSEMTERTKGREGGRERKIAGGRAPVHVVFKRGCGMRVRVCILKDIFKPYDG